VHLYLVVRRPRVTCAALGVVHHWFVAGSSFVSWFCSSPFVSARRALPSLAIAVLAVLRLVLCTCAAGSLWRSSFSTSAACLLAFFFFCSGLSTRFAGSFGSPSALVAGSLLLPVYAVCSAFTLVLWFAFSPVWFLPVRFVCLVSTRSPALLHIRLRLPCRLSCRCPAIPLHLQAASAQFPQRFLLHHRRYVVR